MKSQRSIVPLLIMLFLSFAGCKRGGGVLFGNQEGSPLKNNDDVQKAWDIQNCFRQIYELNQSRVVFISTEQVIKLPYHPFNEFFGIPTEEKRTSLGSGFVISEDGFILTNFHVVAPAGRIVDMITVIIENVSYKAEVRGYDARLDIALLKVEAKKALKPVYLGNSDEVKVGDWAIAIGNPFGLSKSFTVGVVSATGRKDVSNDRESYLQTDAAINPGNSGGPLINIKGEVIGINRMIYSQSGGYMGIGFAIPINRVKDSLEKMKSGKSVKKGTISANLLGMTPDLAYQLGWEYQIGVVVQNVKPRGAADNAGIKRGDVLYSVEGNEISDVDELIQAIENTPVGTTVSFLGWRQGRKMKFAVKIEGK
ncbi:MAG TPA: trypsin-like peptidase domain-containing protein [Spirochaetota bacterium]|nr:trypsin-like peptidase domain-containing protein [Spirochaetota bacterium]